MIVHVVAVVKNEEVILPYMLRHYSTFADTIFIVDQQSTDNTREIVSACPKAVLYDYPYTNGYNKEEIVEFIVDFYKVYCRGVADWVILVDADEFVYHTDILQVLREAKAGPPTVLSCSGYAMISDRLPITSGQIYDELKFGIRSHAFDKPIIIDPAFDFIFGVGKHWVRLPEGVKRKRAGIILLHYRDLSLEYSLARNRKNCANYSRCDRYDHSKVTKETFFDRVRHKLEHRTVDRYFNAMANRTQVVQ